MNDNGSLAHTKWNCKYPYSIRTEIQKKIFYKEHSKKTGKILRELCNRKQVNIVQAEVCPNHIHMLVEIPPKMSVSRLVGFLKRRSTLIIFVRHANLKYKYGNRSFWCRERYVDTAGKNDKKIAEYINNQLDEDLVHDQMTFKEYTDPFTGSN